ncbi:MAG: hypothetical protein U0805_13870 [Pirellulales bacterium]
MSAESATAMRLALESLGRERCVSELEMYSSPRGPYWLAIATRCGDCGYAYLSPQMMQMCAD